MQPRVSAVITTWNRSAMLKKAIASVLSQTFADFELLVLDNGSTDDTAPVVKSFRDPRIRHIAHKPLGISEARNLGLREAKGEFVGFLDDDDEWMPQKLEKQVALFQKVSPRVGMVYGGFRRIKSTGEVYEEFMPTLRGDALLGYLCGRDPLTGSASNPLMRKDACKALGGYDEHLKTSEDWEFYLRLMRNYEIDFVPEAVVRIRKHEGARLGDRLKDAAEAEIIVCKEFADVFRERPRCYASYLRAIGGKFCRIGDFENGRQYLRQAIGISPLDPVTYAQYFISFFGMPAYRRFHSFYKRWR